MNFWLIFLLPENYQYNIIEIYLYFSHFSHIPNTAYRFLETLWKNLYQWIQILRKYEIVKSLKYAWIPHDALLRKDIGDLDTFDFKQYPITKLTLGRNRFSENIWMLTILILCLSINVVPCQNPISLAMSVTVWLDWFLKKIQTDPNINQFPYL